MSGENNTAASGDGVPQLTPEHIPTSPRVFHLPTGSPVATRRHRTYSMNERVQKAKLCEGKISSFCRQKGHGFITPKEGGDDLFVHISDIEGMFVPLPGDVVTFKKVYAPPKNQKYMAVHVNISELKPGVHHEQWDYSGTEQKGTPAS